MAEPSKVIHVRNVGHEISENDLLQLFQPFGVITKLVMLRAKNQVFTFVQKSYGAFCKILEPLKIGCFGFLLLALLQMQDVTTAVNALQFYTNLQPSIRGRNVYIQFSSHQELTTVEQNAQGRGDEVFKLLFSFNCARVLFLPETPFKAVIYMMVAVSWTFSSQTLTNYK